MTIGCPTDFVAVRLGFPNVGDRSWMIKRAIGRASAGYNDYVAPIGGGCWVPFTSANEGMDSTEIVLATEHAPTTIEVRSRDCSRPAKAAGVAWTWTDWAPIRSVSADPSSGMRVLMLRALIPPSQTITYANGQLRSFTGNDHLNHGHDVLIGGLKFNLDHVSDPDGSDPPSPQTWIDNQLATGTLFPLVQFLTPRAGVVGMVTGDSHAQGTSTTEQFSNFGLRATGTLKKAYRGEIPFSMCNCGAGGLTSDVFFARLTSLISAVEPSYAVLPGWTYNDAHGSVKADFASMTAFFGRLLNTIEVCERSGTLPILLTPFPRNFGALTDVQLAPWRWMREQILRLRQDDQMVLDATAILGTRDRDTFDGTYLDVFSDDLMHPNDRGHAEVGAALAKTIRQCV